MTQWHQEVKERDIFIYSDYKFYIAGWYEDEKMMYEEISLSLGYKELDYFLLMVESPYWYLHSDGEWEKSICCYVTDHIQSKIGEYLYQESAQLILAAILPPPRTPSLHQQYLDSITDYKGIGK